MKKNYVLDANVLLHDPHAIFKFEDNNVIIPIYAIEEVDKFELEQSVVELMVAPAVIEMFFAQGEVDIASVPGASTDLSTAEGLYPNAGVLLRNEQAHNHTALGRYDSVKRTVRALRVPREGVM